jgi:hypothetical protein
MPPKSHRTRFSATIRTFGWFSLAAQSILNVISHTMNKAIKLWRQLNRNTRLDDLPEKCGTRDPSNDRPIALLRGEPGYFLWVESLPPEDWNKANDISPDQVRVMIECSIFGWPKADTQRR